MTLTVGIDVGGTKIAAGVVAEDGTVLETTRRESPAEHPAAIADAIGALVAEYAGEHEIAGVGVAAAGFIDLARTEVMFAPNLAWRDEPLRQLVADRVSLPTVIENDANAAAWAEYRFGAGQGARTLAMVTIGTGIGGGLVLGGPENGAVFRGGFGVAAEFGHMRVVPGGRTCACGLRGCWEQYGSGTGLTTRARELAIEDPAGAAILLELAGGDAAAIEGPMVSEAAGRGDRAALTSFAELGRWIGEGLGSLTAILDPDVIIVGGGVSESSWLDMETIRTAFEGAETGFGHRPAPVIARAALGNEAGLIGAADLARRP
ncbi:ROK family glucokinase [Nocardioides marmoriginsengisoli]|uniref:Glucokinase n=1 Tax=Nocardioides marmoriginsengisoli TaxID=661483 RepID=A0A3N0CLA3_9ACTN|nr:ROK family glucokinase [Nocardioides marmoriginsengisoli]RNL64228.1 ROK family glucokinase [Nocardioides marmoriginsengisoli]